jgi:hypothetical protein
MNFKVGDFIIDQIGLDPVGWRYCEILEIKDNLIKTVSIDKFTNKKTNWICQDPISTIEQYFLPYTPKEGGHNVHLQ